MRDAGGQYCDNVACSQTRKASARPAGGYNTATPPLVVVSQFSGTGWEPQTPSCRRPRDTQPERQNKVPREPREHTYS
jgi:hypothetical protein